MVTSRAAAAAGISATGTLVIALAITSVSIARVLVVSFLVWLGGTIGWAVVLWTREPSSSGGAGL